MYAERHTITFTTHSSAGTATAYTSGIVNGPILEIRYVKTDLGDGATITFTGEDTGTDIFEITAMNASATHLPRSPTTDRDGTAITYDATNAVHECVVLANERIKLVISGGDNSKTGTFYIIVG